jgi:hypothetical protein
MATPPGFIQSRRTDMDNNKNALSIIDKARNDGALIYAPQNLDTPPLYKAEATVITARQDEFFNIQGKFMPSKAVVDRIGEAAGVDFIAANCGVKTENRDDDIGKRTVFVGYAQGRTRLPDGSWRQSSIEEYEFDPMLRAQIDSPNDQGVKRKYLDYAKVARQRASTGARVRVIRQLTGMPVTLSAEEVKKPLVFSRIVQNTDYILNTHEGKMMAIAMATGAASMLYGQKAGAPAPEAAAEQEEPPMRNATPGAEEAAGSAPANDDWDAPAATGSTVAPELEKLMQALQEWAIAGGIEGKRAQAIIDRGETDLRILRASLEIIKYLQTNNQRGRKSCLDALDMLVPDPVVLEDVVSKIKGVAA